MSSFNDCLAERIWGGKDSSLDADDCAESRRVRFEPIQPGGSSETYPTPRLNLWAAGRLAEWCALQISTSKEAVCAAVVVKSVAQKLMSGGAPL